MSLGPQPNYCTFLIQLANVRVKLSCFHGTWQEHSLYLQFWEGTTCLATWSILCGG